MRTILVASVLGVVGLAGCLEGPGGLLEDSLGFDPEVPSLTLGDRVVSGDAPLEWEGEIAAGETDELAFLAWVPPGYWTSHQGRLEVSILWGLYEDYDLDLQVTNPLGLQAVDGEEPEAAIGVQGVGVVPVVGSASVALLPEAGVGVYAIKVTGTHGRGPYRGVIQWDSEERLSGAPQDLLPNIVNLVPRDLTFDDPDGLDRPMQATGVKGCRADEVAEMGVRRCLRFSNGIGNIGAGPLEMRLTPAEGASSLAGGGDFVQRIWKTDGSWTDTAVGRADLHPNHGHFHYVGAATFTVFEYDLETQTRGDAVADSRKTGFCFADLAIVELGLPHTRGPAYDASGCFDPTVHGAWMTGLNPNWYDRYHWTWFEQYVDVSGVPDGVYELAAIANEAGTMIETDVSDNEASVVFRLAGDTVVELGPPSTGPL